ncbi:MAG: hypothetical protein LBQ79_10390 [Deltaproteobacteria bacterium]|jgi:hypothetical protein|nr:hypothetical protein [Deltaproteobacteria bacterium]
MEDADDKTAERPGRPVDGAPGTPGNPVFPAWLRRALARVEVTGLLAEELDFLPGEGLRGTRPRKGSPAADFFAKAADAGLLPQGSFMTLTELARAAAASPDLAGFLAASWHDRVSAWPFPGPRPDLLRAGSLLDVLFAHLELLRRGRDCGGRSEELLTALLDAPPPTGPEAAGGGADFQGRAAAAAGVRDGVRAWRVLSGDLPEAETAMAEAVELVVSAAPATGGSSGGDVPPPVPSPSAASSPPVPSFCRGGRGFRSFFRYAAGLRDAWNALAEGIGVYREAISAIDGMEHVKFITDQEPGIPEDQGDFADFCFRNSGRWPARAEEFLQGRLDEFEAAEAALPLPGGRQDAAWAADAIMNVCGAVSADGLSLDAARLAELAGDLEALGPGADLWEDAVPLAAVIVWALSAPKPLDPDDLEPLNMDFGPAFHKKLRKGELDGAAFPGGPPAALRVSLPASTPADSPAPAAAAPVPAVAAPAQAAAVSFAAEIPAPPGPVSGGESASCPSGGESVTGPTGGGESPPGPGPVSGGESSPGPPSGGDTRSLRLPSGPRYLFAPPDAVPASGQTFVPPLPFKPEPSFPPATTDGMRRLLAVSELAEETLSAGGLDAKEARKFCADAAQAALAEAGGGALADAKASAAAMKLEKRIRDAGKKYCERVWDRLDRLGDFENRSEADFVETIDNLLDVGEVDVASDLVAEASTRYGMSWIPRNPVPGAAEKFFAFLGKLDRDSDPFAAGAGTQGEGLRSGAAQDPAPAERVWRRLVQSFRPGEGGRTAALEKLVIWLGFATVRGFAVRSAGGGGLWREYSAEAGSEPPLPAWGEGPSGGLSVMVFHGGDPRGTQPASGGDPATARAPVRASGEAPCRFPGQDSAPPGLLEALSEWTPCPGTVPLAIVLEPLSAGARGAVRALARSSRRDLVVLDPALTAALACAAPLDKQLRQEWLFSAGGIYGSYLPFTRYQISGSVGFAEDPVGSGPFVVSMPVGTVVPYPLPEPPASIALARPDVSGGLIKSINSARGVVRLEGAAGSGKTELLKTILDDPDAGGDWVCLMDWADIEPSETAERGPLGAVLAKAAETLELPDWDVGLGAAENLRLLEGDAAGRGQAGRVTVMVDGADGLMDAVLEHPGDLELLRGIAVREGAMKLVMAGRKVTRRMERHPASPLSVLRPSLSLASNPVRLSMMILAPIGTAGFVFENDALVARMMAHAFWNPGAAAVLAGAVLEETVSGLPPDACPPFVIGSRAVRRAAADPAVRQAMQAIAMAPLDRDPLLRAVALAALSGPPGRRSASRPDPTLHQALDTLRVSWPAAFRDSDPHAFRHYAQELARAGFLSVDRTGVMRPRSAAHARLLGGRDGAKRALAALKPLPAPPDALLLCARRFLPPEGQEPWPPPDAANGKAPAPLPPAAPLPSGLEALAFTRDWGGRLLGAHLLQDSGGGGDPALCPSPSPFTILQESFFFDRPSFDFRRLCVTPAGGASRAGRALAGLCAMERLSGASGAVFVRLKARDRQSLAAAVKVLRDVELSRLDPHRPLNVMCDCLSPPGPGAPDPFESVAHAVASSGRGDDALSGCTVTLLCPPEDALRNAASETGTFARSALYSRIWTEGAVAVLLAGWGVDPELAHTVHDRTGGWDSLVASEARALAGLTGGEPVMPQDSDNAVPLELHDAVDELRGKGPMTLAELRVLCPGAQVSDLPGVRGAADVLASLMVLVPEGERDGERLWRLDPRFR